MQERQAAVAGLGATLGGPLDIGERLRARRASLQEQIDGLDVAIESLDKNPELETILNAIQSVGIY